MYRQYDLQDSPTILWDQISILRSVLLILPKGKHKVFLGLSSLKETENDSDK